MRRPGRRTDQPADRRGQDATPPGDADHRGRLRRRSPTRSLRSSCGRTRSVQLPAAVRPEHAGQCGAGTTAKSVVQGGLRGRPGRLGRRQSEIGVPGRHQHPVGGSRRPAAGRRSRWRGAWVGARTTGQCTGGADDCVHRVTTITSPVVAVPSAANSAEAAASTTTSRPSSASTAATSRSASTAVRSRRPGRGLRVQRAHDAGHRGSGDQPAGGPGRLHRHRRRQGHRLVGHLDHQPRGSGVQAGDHSGSGSTCGRDGCGGLDGWYVDNVTGHHLRQRTSPVRPTYVGGDQAKPTKVARQNESFDAVVTVVRRLAARPTGTVEIFEGLQAARHRHAGAGGKVTIKITKKMAKKLKAREEHADGHVPRFGDRRREPRTTSW